MTLTGEKANTGVPGLVEVAPARLRQQMVDAGVLPEVQDRVPYQRNGVLSHRRQGQTNGLVIVVYRFVSCRQVRCQELVLVMKVSPQISRVLLLSFFLGISFHLSPRRDRGGSKRVVSPMTRKSLCCCWCRTSGLPLASFGRCMKIEVLSPHTGSVEHAAWPFFFCSNVSVNAEGRAGASRVLLLQGISQLSRGRNIWVKIPVLRNSRREAGCAQRNARFWARNMFRRQAIKKMLREFFSPGGEKKNWALFSYSAGGVFF